jgi:hypothetical protein
MKQLYQRKISAVEFHHIQGKTYTFCLQANGWYLMK